MIGSPWQDLRYAVRNLRKHALLSFAVIATLTLGIGISTGVFTFFNAEALRAQVDKDFDSFVRIYSAYTRDPKRPGQPGSLTMEDYFAFRDRAKSLRDLAASAEFHGSLGEDSPVEVRARLVTPNYFSVYGLEQPLLGRLLQPEDYTAANPVVVLSEYLWRHQFEADLEIIGKVAHVNGQSVTVVGVAPPFGGMYNGVTAWLPYTLETYLKQGDNLLRPGEAAWLDLVVGRLNPGFSQRDAAAELKLIASQQDRLHPGRTTTLTVTNGSAIEEPDNRDRLTLLFGVILVALIIFVMIVCVNVTTLLLARAAGRRQEIAVRLALGASKARLIRMLLVETFLLAGLAGFLSLDLAYDLPGILDRWLTNRSAYLGRWHSLVPDWRVFGYIALVTVLAGMIAGLTPALQSLKINLSEMLKGRQSLPSGARGSRLYGLLIGAQVALSFLLLCGAILCLRTAWRAAHFAPGLETRHVLWTGLSVPRRASQPPAAFRRTLTERLTALPGVQSVAFSSRVPFNTELFTDVQQPGLAIRRVAVNDVSSNYFDVLGIPIVSGRALEESDRCGQTVCDVVVSQQLAREFWPGENALGKTLRLRGGASLEVVGVARDVSCMKLGGPDDPMLYFPWNPTDASPANPLVRFSGDSAALTRAVASAVHELAPELSIRARTLQALREEGMEGLLSMTQLVVLLCAVGVMLAIMGIYGVVAFAVSQRTREIGIRLALGAQKKDIYQAVLGSSGRPIVIGLLLGLALTVATFSALASLLEGREFAINVMDPINYVLTALLLAGVALAAMMVPARRATRIDPMVALRYE